MKKKKEIIPDYFYSICFLVMVSKQYPSVMRNLDNLVGFSVQSLHILEVLIMQLQFDFIALGFQETNQGIQATIQSLQNGYHKTTFLVSICNYDVLFILTEIQFALPIIFYLNSSHSKRSHRARIQHSSQCLDE